MKSEENCDKTAAAAGLSIINNKIGEYYSTAQNIKDDNNKTCAL